MLKQVWCRQQQKSDRKRANNAGELGVGAGGFGDRGARTAAADREALKKAGCQIGCAEPHHLLVGIDPIAQSGGKGPRKYAGIGE